MLSHTLALRPFVLRLALQPTSFDLHPTVSLSLSLLLALLACCTLHRIFLPCLSRTLSECMTLSEPYLASPSLCTSRLMLSPCTRIKPSPGATSYQSSLLGSRSACFGSLSLSLYVSLSISRSLSHFLSVRLCIFAPPLKVSRFLLSISPPHTLIISY